MHFISKLAVTALALAPASGATDAVAAPPAAWPPTQPAGERVAHIGEEHLTDEDGPRVLPAVVAELLSTAPRAS